MILYAKRFMEKCLELAGLPSTYASILKYERSGVLMKPDAIVYLREDSTWRLYNEEEIIVNVLSLLKYKYPTRMKDVENLKTRISKYLNKNGK